MHQAQFKTSIRIGADRAVVNECKVMDVFPEHNERHFLRRVWNFRHYLQDFLFKELWEVSSPANKLRILAGGGEG